MLTTDLENAIRDVPDFPKPGIIFKDITPVFAHPELCRDVVEAFQTHFHHKSIQAVAGIESRGFLLGLLLANRLNLPFILLRKAGKLPGKVVSQTYQLEYGTATIEVHTDAIQPGWNVLIHDDLLATGGTAEAAAQLIKKQQGHIAGFAFLAELNFLNGRALLNPHSADIFSAMRYP